MAAAFVFHIITAEIVIGALYKQPGTSPKGDRDHEIAITASRKTLLVLKDVNPNLV